MSFFPNLYIFRCR